MILIISRENDKSTDEVIGWLKYFNQSIFRINQKQNIRIENFTIKPKLNFRLVCSETKGSIDFDSISVVYYRIGCIDLSEVSSIPRELIPFFQNERKTVTNLLYLILESKIFRIGSYVSEVNNNKIEDLIIAQSVGLNVPNVLITTARHEVINFLEKNKRVISKPIGNYARFGAHHRLEIRSLQREEVQALDDYFHPALYQEYIEKEYELRTFFVLDQFFSMAILSQNNPKTKFDFRNYDVNYQNRVEPITLPVSIKKKLLGFARSKNLTTGSFDLILGKDGNIYFLEVNPSGQFDWLSKRCNYNIEKIIAKTLHENAK